MKALDILECFKDDQQEVGISEISVKVNLPVSSVHRIVQSLEFEGFLLQNLETRRYRLGTKLLSLSYKCQSYQKYMDVASARAEELGQITGETVNVAICSCDSTIHIYRTESPHVLRPTFPLNRPFPAYCTAVGRIFLSEMSDTAQRWAYNNSRDEIGMNEESFLTLLHDVRANGYALDDESFSAGLRCVAAPVRLSSGNVVYALSISAPVVRMGDAVYQKAQQLVVEYAAKISADIQSME